MGKAALRGALLVALCAIACAPAASAQTNALPTPSSSVVIVLDSSSAMRGTKLRAAKAAVRAARRAVPAGTPMQVRRYRGHANGVAPCSPEELAGAPTRRATLVLVEAGAPGCSSGSTCLVATPRSGARMDVIGLEVSPADRRALQCAAAAAGGIYRDARTPAALRPELVAAVQRATRDRRSLGSQLAGGLEQQQATPVRPGQYVDSIAPDGERWYAARVPPGGTLSVAATVIAPPGRDMSAPGSSLELGGSGGAGAFSAITATDLFSFESDGTATVQTAAPLTPGSYSVRVALHDSPDRQLARRLHGSALPLELAFNAGPARRKHLPRARPALIRAVRKRDVSWGAGLGSFAGTALIAFVIAARARRKGGAR